MRQKEVNLATLDRRIIIISKRKRGRRVTPGSGNKVEMKMTMMTTMMMMNALDWQRF
jgi:hypothetical protein